MSLDRNLIKAKGGKYGAHQSDPEDDVFIDEAAEVLVQDEEARANKGSVLEVQLALGDVCELQGNSKVQNRLCIFVTSSHWCL